MKKLKGLLLALLSILLIVGGLFVFQKQREKNKTVEVVNVGSMGLDWMENDLRSSGIIYERQSQTVYVNSNQLVREVYVNEGDAVKAGDPLLAYDIESQQLAVDMKALEVERERVHLTELQKDLNTIKQLKPYVPTPVPEETENPDVIVPREDEDKPLEAIDTLTDLSGALYETDGTTESPLIFFVKEEGKIKGSFFNALKKEKKTALIEIRKDDKFDGELVVSHTFNGKYLIRDYNDEEIFYARTMEVANGGGGPIIFGLGDFINPSKKDSDDSSGNVPDGSTDDGSNVWPDDSDYPGEYTAEEIAQMIADKQEEIRRSDLNYRKLQLELKVMQEELGDGIVYARKDGVVKIAHAPGDIPQDGSPFIKIASGEGVMIQGTISEMLLDRVKVGQTLTASSWETGEEYIATVSSIDDFPATNSYYYGEGNPNASYYNFYAIIENGDDVPENTYLEISFDTSDSSADMMFINRVYVRSDATGKYVMKDDGGVLKKQYIKTGKTYWGEYFQVLSGITRDDYVAFPYGDGAIEGVKTTISEEGGMFY